MIRVTEKDKNILRRLGNAYAAIASLPIQKEKKKLWQTINDKEVPGVALWINEIPWHEMNIDNELTLQTEDPFLQTIETKLRRQLYQWKHMPADMVLEPYVVCPKVILNSGIGIDVDTDFGIRSMNKEDSGAIHTYHFEPLLKTEDDIEKIKDPVISCDEKTTQERNQALENVFNGVLDVVVRGEPGFWYAIWDGIIAWFGVQQGFELLIDDPDFVHKCVSRMTDAYLHGLDQYTALGLMASNNNNTRVGSGGFGYTTQLPPDIHSSAALKNIWGCSASQIFSNVSPAMHDEFALQYEIKWMERFGLNYYGCCEPLHDKLEILRKVPNLRKISISPWADLEKSVNRGGSDYVLSCKPSPANFAGNSWNLDTMEAELNQILEKTKGCNVEILMKDISTVNGKPERLFEWEKMAMRQIESYR